MTPRHPTVVVGGVVAQAAVQNTDEPVGEGAEGLLVGRAAAAGGGDSATPDA
jgi:hypothetical protein